jgi:hypothetical protein
MNRHSYLWTYQLAVLKALAEMDSHDVEIPDGAGKSVTLEPQAQKVCHRPFDVDNVRMDDEVRRRNKSDRKRDKRSRWT